MWKVWWKKNTRPSADRASFIFFNEEYFDSSYEEFRRNLDLLREGRFSRLSAKNTDILSLGGRPVGRRKGQNVSNFFSRISKMRESSVSKNP